MSQSEDDDYAFFGTPLEQFEEDFVPRKKPITVQDQIATDKHGRRRFHGAFTGGFSAGFYNTVGSLEGWTPSSYKSSRDKKATSTFQKPEDYMDEEDLEEFGIAPTVVRTKPEYSGDRGIKRERVRFSDGPIPGEPVLKSILEPVRETIGVLLLMKMGWKPGQGIGPRLSKLQKKIEKNKNKVYGCSLPDQASDSDSGEDVEENLIDKSILFAPEEHEIHFLNPKTNTFGMGYSGLEKKSILSMNSTLKNETFRMFDNNKKLAIKGQAFGVGAFEEDDDDIYAKEDMSQYDFALETSGSLKEIRKKEREEKDKLLVIMGSDSVLEGFVQARNPNPVKKFFPPPELPPDYQPVHPKRKTRFDALPTDLKHNKIKGRHIITSEDRAAILGDARPEDVTHESRPVDIIAENTDTPLETFRPFIADPEKQQRYEKYLHLVKIGAKDAFLSIQPKSMSDWEKERERNEFEQAARLYKPLSGLMRERFAHGELLDDTSDPLATVPRTSREENADIVEAAKSKMYGKLTRRITDWSPCSLLCKRMNIAEPLDRIGNSLCQVANASNKRQNRNKYSIFNFLDVEKVNSFEKIEDVKQEISQENLKLENDKQIVDPKVDNIKKSSLILPKPILDFEEPIEKKDLFKAIFCSDEEESDKDERKEDSDEKNKSQIVPPLTKMNALRNTSPPRGIFANLDLDAINKRKTVSLDPAPQSGEKELEKDGEKEQEQVTESEKDKIGEYSLYGPSLPTKPIFSNRIKEMVNIKPSSESSSEGEWVERKEERKQRKHKKHKKHKEKKKHKGKNKKKDH